MLAESGPNLMGNHAADAGRRGGVLAYTLLAGEGDEGGCLLDGLVQPGATMHALLAAGVACWRTRCWAWPLTRAWATARSSSWTRTTPEVRGAQAHMCMCACADTHTRARTHTRTHTLACTHARALPSQARTSGRSSRAHGWGGSGWVTLQPRGGRCSRRMPSTTSCARRAPGRCEGWRLPAQWVSQKL